MLIIPQFFLNYNVVIDHLLIQAEQYIRHWDAREKRPGSLDFGGGDSQVYLCLEHNHRMTEGDMGNVRSTEDSSAQVPILGLPMELMIELDSEGSGYFSTDSKGGVENAGCQKSGP